MTGSGDTKESKMINSGLRQKVKIGILTAALVAFSTMTVLAAEFVSVVKDGVNLRSGPDTSNEILFQLPAGYPLKVLARKGKWLKVSDFEDDKGWIYDSLVSENPYVIFKVRECNVRSGPGTNFDKVGSLAREVILKKVDSQGDWIKVSHPKITGWLHTNLVWP